MVSLGIGRQTNITIMQPEQYDDWYRMPRGRWIGETEYRLLRNILRPQVGESLLDVGCGTGYFARRFAEDGKLAVTGIDPNSEWLAYAAAHACMQENFVEANALALPFPDHVFDVSISITALCFVSEQRKALAEILRVTRRRFAIGLLNRHSLLYWQKGRHGGSGAYSGAHWHSAAEIRQLFSGFPVRDLIIHSAVFMPQGGKLSQLIEGFLPSTLLCGSFILVAGEVMC